MAKCFQPDPPFHRSSRACCSTTCILSIRQLHVPKSDLPLKFLVFYRENSLFIFIVTSCAKLCIWTFARQTLHVKLCITNFARQTLHCKLCTSNFTKRFDLTRISSYFRWLVRHFVSNMCTYAIIIAIRFFS